MLRTLLIDDEPAVRADLGAKLAEHPQVVVVGEAATLRLARELLRTADYDLVLLDIQLIGGNAFELVGEVREGARIVFVSGYDAYALRAFEVNALDYLLKPVTAERLARALARLELPGAKEDEAVPAGLRPDDTIYLRSGLKARFAPVAEICVITASDNYTEVRLADGTKVFMRKPMKAWEDGLPPTHFMRVHRTQIVNLARVTRYERDGEERTRLFVQGCEQAVQVSRERWTDFRARLLKLRPET